MGKKEKGMDRKGEKVEKGTEVDFTVQKKSMTREEAFEYFRHMLGSAYYRHQSRCDTHFEEIWYAIQDLPELSQKKKILILVDLIKAEIRSLETQYKEEVEIAGITFRKGDTVEIGVGRQRYIGTFLGFDRTLYVISVKCDDNEMIIPYKNLKYMRKIKG